MAEIRIEKIMFPSLYKFLNRNRIFNVYTNSTHTYIVLFIDIKEWCIMQRRIFGWSSVACQSKYRKTAFTCKPKHWWYKCFAVGNTQAIHKIKLPLLCFGVPKYRAFFARINVQNIGRQYSFWF